MAKSKKHSPIQNELDSILDQVPDDKMDLFVKELQKFMMEQKAKQSLAKSQPSTEPDTEK